MRTFPGQAEALLDLGSLPPQVAQLVMRTPGGGDGGGGEDLLEVREAEDLEVARNYRIFVTAA